MAESSTSAVNARFRYHPSQQCDSSESTIVPVKSCTSPELMMKSASRDNLFPQSSSYKEKSSRLDHGETAVRSFEFREDPSFWKEHNVQVIIRLRPLSRSEMSVQGNNRCVRQESSQTITWTGHPESRFTFDLVADETVSQEMLFKVAGVPMVENCMEGYNSCMFAYGQTGSGKTHTMLGDIEGGGRRHSVDCGMTPRVFEYLFSRIQKERDARRDDKLKFTCRCSFLEIYNEQIFDLLDPSSTNLQIREDTKKGVHVENLCEIEVTSARDVLQQLIQGAANRKVAATNMNRASSRSHSVFTCILESKWESQGLTHHRFARLNLVDLAGSERQKSSGAEGERLKEATNINKSLSSLGLVIMNLVSVSNGKPSHVPYRDSKLTFLLQDSLGGNAKTIIIANISPSSCCSLETLSTLKFAQRAKFIKNHAIVNEDASGDMLALRVENQNLKKEVSYLRNLVNGGVENQDANVVPLAFHGSPGLLKWDGLLGFSSPLMSEKKMPHKKDYELALIGAFRRGKDKDTALQALAEENQAAVQLAKQREDEIQSLKMRLKFREAGIKRLEAVASGKISAEAHLLTEREEFLKEIEVLRAQVEHNQEVTRFAMENLRLKEEIRRLKSFYEEGEREGMTEQITILENKLLEALDWKFMHESDPTNTQKQNPSSVMGSQSDDNFLCCNQLIEMEPGSSWCTSMTEENEFLHIQAIQNQSEIDALQKKLEFCMEEKEKLERHVEDLAKELQAERLFKEAMAEKGQNQQTELPSLQSDHIPMVGQSDQTDIKTMVDAIAAASQREAEAHEMAISMSKENDELRSKLKVLIEDNNKLIDLYERAVAENDTRSSEAGSSHLVDVAKEEDEVQVKAELEGLQHQLAEMHDLYERAIAANNKRHSEDRSAHLADVPNEEVIAEIDSLKHQLAEMHEENDKLLSLYEKAMQERDELKRVIDSDECNTRSFSCPEKLVEIDEGQGLRSGGDSSVSLHDDFPTEDIGSIGVDSAGHLAATTGSLLDETHLYEVQVQDCFSQISLNSQTSNCSDLAEASETSHLEVVKSDIAEQLKEGMMELDGLREPEKHENNEHLENTCDLESNGGEHTSKLNMTAQTDREEKPKTFMVEVLNELSEKLVDAQAKLALLENVGKLESGILAKQREYAHLKSLWSELQERKDLTNSKFSALKHSLTSFPSSLHYFEQREARARSMLIASSEHLLQKKEKLTSLHASKKELMDSFSKLKQTEVELKRSLESLKLKLHDANKKLECDKVLLAIDNIEKTTSDVSHRWKVSGKATELLKFEEEKTELQNLIKLDKERLGNTRKEAEAVHATLCKIDHEIKPLKMDLQMEAASVEDMECKLQHIVHEKEMLMEVRENGLSDFEHMIIEYYNSLFEAGLKEEEMKMLEEELAAEATKMEGFKRAKDDTVRRKTEPVEAINSGSFLADKMEADLHEVQSSVSQMNLLLQQLYDLYA